MAELVRKGEGVTLQSSNFDVDSFSRREEVGAILPPFPSFTHIFADVNDHCQCRNITEGKSKHGVECFYYLSKVSLRFSSVTVAVRFLRIKHQTWQLAVCLQQQFKNLKHQQQRKVLGQKLD